VVALLKIEPVIVGNVGFFVDIHGTPLWLNSHFSFFAPMTGHAFSRLPNRESSVHAGPGQVQTFHGSMGDPDLKIEKRSSFP
jgi:hypothetical protein